MKSMASTMRTQVEIWRGQCSRTTEGPQEPLQAEAGFPEVKVLLWGHPHFSASTGGFVTSVKALCPGPEFQEWMLQPDPLKKDPWEDRERRGGGSSVGEMQPVSFSLRVSLTLEESGLLSAVAAASSSVLVNNSVSHPSILQRGCDGNCRGAESYLLQTAEGRTWGLEGASVGSGAGAFQATLQPLLAPFGDRIVPSISLPALRTL